MNTSTVIARYLAAAGVHHLFGYPGSPNVEFLEAIRQEGIEFVLARREGTAGLMAEAYGQVTGLPGVCMSTLGPGSSNLVNAVADAMLSRVPMIALSGQIEGKQEQIFTHQVLDHNRMFAPVSKWATYVRSDTVSTVMRKALRIAMAERPGPVHISIAEDMVGADATDDAITLPPLHPAAQGIDVFATDLQADPMKKLNGAKRPMIVAGISAVRGEAGPALVSLAEKIGCPVVVAPMAKGVFPEDHDNFAGTLDVACSTYLWDFVKTADLILAVGFDAVELIKPWSPQCETVHIDSTPNTDQIYPAAIEFVGPIPAILDVLGDEFSGNARWTAKEISEHRDGLRTRYYEGRVAGKLNPSDVVDIAREAATPDTIISADVGSHKLRVGQGWTAHEPRSVLISNGLSSMGYALPAAIAARVARPDRPVIGFMGDGGFAMVQGELRLAASLKLGITVIVFCDNSLNLIERKQIVQQYPSIGTVIEATDIAKLSESMGCEGVNVTTAKELEAALSDRSVSREVPLVIGATIDPTQYLTTN
jgi:acetolactate synthase I/II/III large subunit